jgi:cyclic pyranopterin phosphate synthase
MNTGRRFEFDAVDEAMSLVPLAARRVLDHLGAKLSLEGWRSLCQADRLTLVRLGSEPEIAEAEATAVLARAAPAPRATDKRTDPESLEPPSTLLELLGPERPLSAQVWSQLSALERWVLVKVAGSKNSERLPAAYDEILNSSRRLTHLNTAGEAHMVGTSAKPVTLRRAVAGSRVTMSEAAHRALISGNAPKGDVLGTARIAGIMAAKQTSLLIPLCHPIHLTQVDLELTISASSPSVDVRAQVTALDRTGVEMEAMVAASVAALTIYDMLKAVDRAMVIGPTQLLEKSGGKSGVYQA